MARDPRQFVFVGIRSAVIALDSETGDPAWRAELSGSDFVTVLWDGVALLAANNGEVFRLDPATGAIVWHNELKGLGRGLVSLASTRAPQAGGEVAAAASKRRQDQQTAAGGAAM
jgi:outer membrane protein assembly factor BamB